MLILALDTTCDETCAAVMDADTLQLRSDVVHSQVAFMQKYGGVVPEIASRQHLYSLPLVVDEALRRAGITFRDLGHIVVTNRPGLMGAILAGVSYAKSLAWTLGIPFSTLDHVECHLFSPLLGDGRRVPPYPWIALVVSGGHTEIFHVDKIADVQWLGGTLDDAAGEAFDKVGKLLGLGYPAGPEMDRLTREKIATVDPDLYRNAIRFPRASTPAFHFSYSGLKTAVREKLARQENSDPIQIAACAQEAILEPLVTEVRRALAAYPGAHAVVTGGVACNSRLRELLPEAFFPAPKHCSDNAAMVAVRAADLYRQGRLVESSYSVGAAPTSALLVAAQHPKEPTFASP